MHFFFIRPHPWHMEVSWPGIESEPQLGPMLQLEQCQILESTVLDQGWNLHLCSDPSRCSQILNPLHHSRNSYNAILYQCSFKNLII